MNNLEQVQKDGFLLGIALFNGSFSAPILQEYQNYINSGGSLDQLYINLLKTDTLKSEFFYPSYLNNAQIVDKFLTNLTGNYLSENIYNEVRNIMVNELERGVEKGVLFRIIVNALNNVSDTDINYGEAAKYFHKKLEVTKYYATVIKGAETDVFKLQEYIKNIKSDTDISTPEKINQIISNATLPESSHVFKMTKNDETFVGGAGSDIFYANMGYNNITEKYDITTLSGNDVIDGKSGMDVLEVNYGDNSLNSGISGTTQIKNIELIRVIQSNNQKTPMKIDLGGVTAGKVLEIENNGVNSPINVQTYKNINEIFIRGNSSDLSVYELDSKQKMNLTKLNIDVTAVTDAPINLKVGVKNLETLNIKSNTAVTIDGINLSKNVKINSNADLTLNQELNVKTVFTGSDKKESIIIGNHESSIDLKGGNDTLKINTPILDKNIKVDGGLGEDTIILNAKNAQSLSENNNFNNIITGFERLEIINPTNSSDIFNINMENLDAIRVLNLKNNNLNLEINNFANVGDLELENYSGNLKINNIITNDVQTGLALKLNTKNGFGTNEGTITINDVKDLLVYAKDTNLSTKNNTENIKLNLIGDNIKTVIMDGNININFGDFTSNNTVSFLSSTLKIAKSETFSFTFKNMTDDIRVISGNHQSNYDATASNKNNSFELGTLKDIVKAGNGNNTIVGKGGNDEITTGSGNDTITVGTGNAKINVGKGFDNITLGLGDHEIKFHTNDAKEFYTTITGVNTKDKIIFDESNLLFNKNKIVLADTATLNEYLNEATKNTGNEVNWFEFNENTYITLDKNNSATYVEGEDGFVKLIGVVDLSNSIMDNGILMV